MCIVYVFFPLVWKKSNYGSKTAPNLFFFSALSCLKKIQQGFYMTYENLVLRSLGMGWLPR